MRPVGMLAVGLVVVATLFVVAALTAAPLARSCAATIGDGACAETVTASLSRGLPPIHPLILAAHVEPGPAASNAELGHRATVTFDLLGVPGTTSVRLFLDMGGTWGGEVDRTDAELAIWTLLPLAGAGLAGLLLMVATRGRP